MSGSRFFATGSDSESESSSEEEPLPRQPAATYTFSDEEEETKRVVRSAKEKRYEDLMNIIKQIRNYKKIKDMSSMLSTLQDYKPVPSTSTGVLEEVHEYKWSTSCTRALIDLYGKYFKLIGTYRIRSQKQMWEVIAQELRKELKINVSAKHCENRWKVLKRNYKKHLSNYHLTPGRGKKHFEYVTEMEHIFALQENSDCTELLLDTTTLLDTNELLDTNIVNVPEPAEQIELQPQQAAPSTPAPQKKLSSKRKFCSLESEPNYRRAYYEKKLKIEIEKLEAMKRKNQLMEERNQILSSSKCCKCMCMNSEDEVYRNSGVSEEIVHEVTIVNGGNE